MKLLIFGEGGISAGVQEHFDSKNVEVIQVPHEDVDVRHLVPLRLTIDEIKPDWVMNCAGVSDVRWAPREVITTNLIGAINVASAAGDRPTILMGSAAGFVGKKEHPFYGPSKAGVINFVESWAERGNAIWGIHPGRVDTAMRQADWPNEDKRTRLEPTDIGVVVEDIMLYHFGSGANIVVRKVGMERIDYYEVPRWTFPSGL